LAVAYYNLSELLAAKGSNGEAEEFYRQAIAKDPKLAEALDLREASQRQLGKASVSSDLMTESNVNSKTQRLKFVSPENNLTNEYLMTVVLPYMQALEDLQRALDQLQGNPSRPWSIHSIVRGSIGVNFDGGAEIVQWVRDTFEKWRLAHAKKMARLKEKELETSVAVAQLGLDVQRSQSAVEMRKADAETSKSAAEAEHIRLETQRRIQDSEHALALRREEVKQAQLTTQRMKFELERDKYQLALEFVRNHNAGLPEPELFAYVAKVKGSIDTMLDTGAQLDDAS
jgi:tetratricopeptide (TPR) repeat protein